MITFSTITGSLYEVDPDAKRIRRITGVDAPTARQGPDGEWRDYERLIPDPVEPGREVTIVWELIREGPCPECGDCDGGAYLARSTVTSMVV